MPGTSRKGSESHTNPNGRVRRRVASQPADLCFARVADIEGFPDIAELFKDTADAETGHAVGHLDFLEELGDRAGVPGKTEANLK